MNDSHRKQPARRAVTLVELLVVVTIMLLLAAFAIPTIRPLTEGRRIREATRAIDVFLTQAKTRATVIQRPVGVVFERFRQLDANGNPVYHTEACNVLRMVEIPPPYAGDFIDSRVRIQNWTTSAGNYIVLKVMVQYLSLSNGLLRRGDCIQFNYQGPIYTIINDTGDDGASDSGQDFEVDGDGFIVFDNPTASYTTRNALGWITSHVLTVRVAKTDIDNVSWPAPASVMYPVNPTLLVGGQPRWSGDVAFQFYRQPQASPGDPLRLPRNTVVDLSDSGYSLVTPDTFDCSAATDPRGPMILFTPNGAVQSVYHWDATGAYDPHPVMTPVFLMVGKWERTGLNADGTSYADDGLHNWQDASNLWMSVGPQNGFVTTAEVDTHYLDDQGNTDPSDDVMVDNVNSLGVSVPATLYDSRRYARQQQISKGALSE